MNVTHTRKTRARRVTERPPALYRVNGLAPITNRPGNITIIPSAQSLADRDRRDALKRTISMAPDEGCYFCDDAEATRKAAEQ